MVWCYHLLELSTVCHDLPILWPPHAKSWLIGKDPDAGGDWGQEEKGMTEDEIPGWHHRLDGQEFGWTPGVGDGQGGLACCDSWDRKESDTTERLNWLTDTVKGISVVDETQIDVVLKFLCFIIQQMLAVWSLVPLPFLNPAWTSGSSWLP